MDRNENKIRIGITQGDINGVGAEVIVKALSNPDILDLFTPVIFGNADVFSEVAEAVKAEDFKFKTIKNTAEISDGDINVLETGVSIVKRTPGEPSVEAGTAAVEALRKAVEAIENGDIDLLVTAPIDKHSVQSDTFQFKGHTEYLEDRFVVSGGKALMILADDKIRVALVTTHLPLKDVAKKITKERVAESIKGFNRALKMDFGCERPKIAVLSLNPHCGDDGVLGNEEKEAITPAIEECQNEGILAFGPIAADGFFGSGSFNNFDGVLAMYHDQGLAPFKALAAGKGVNYTAGLDIIRTSPAHGTGYDIAAEGIADDRSMRDAIYAAIDIARRRCAYLDASENPLEIRDKSSREHKGKKQESPADELE